MRDVADLGQNNISVNNGVLPQTSETEENHNREAWNIFPLLL